MTSMNFIKIYRTFIILLVAVAAFHCGDDAATYKGGSVSMQELDTAARMDIYRAEKQIYEARYRQLMTLLSERLLALEAKETESTPDALVNTYIASNLQPVDDQILRYYYDMGAGGDQPFEKIKEQMREMVMSRQKNDLRYSYIRQLMEKYNTEIKLKEPEAPRLDIEVAGHPFWGKEDAKVVIVEFSDFECPYCRQMQAGVMRLKQEYSEKVRWVFIDFPLSFHQQAEYAHKAAHCAGSQGRYFEMQQAIFAASPEISPAQIDQMAVELKYDINQFKSCLGDQNGSLSQKIAQNISYGEELGGGGTPTLIINGVYYEGGRDYESLKQKIESLL